MLEDAEIRSHRAEPCGSARASSHLAGASSDLAAALRALLAGAVATSVLALASIAEAQTPQVTVYIGNYGSAPPPGAPPPPSGLSGPTALPTSGANAALLGGAAVAQAAAYQQYLLYVATMSPQAREGAAANAAQYFTNGAALTTVPSAGPGAAYFSNGAETTRLPPAASAAPAASAPTGAPAPSTALPPWWWSEPAPPAASAPVPPPAASAIAPPPPPAPAETDEPAMSFEEWLRSMGASIPEAQAAAAEVTPPPPPNAPAESEAPVVAEPSSTANDVRPRASYALRQKTRERAAHGAIGNLGVLVGAAFAVGLLIGGLAMRRARNALNHGS